MNKTKLDIIKQNLLKELDGIKLHVVNLSKSDPLNDPEHANDNAAIDGDAREQETHQRIEAEIDSLKIRLNNINVALGRIEKGNYGTCKRCNMEIPEKRLELIPETIYCVTCEGSLKK